jgi:tetratricopeptide (TPR) repeat protein
MTLALVLMAAAATRTPAEQALDSQDRARLEGIVAQAGTKANSAQQDADSQYQAALAGSLLSQLAFETGERGLGKSAAETGIGFARRAVALRPNSAEYHRILGTLCGQVIPVAAVTALKWGRCAIDEVRKATELDPKSAKAWMSRGVGNYYLPAAFGGGLDQAAQDLRKALQLDPGLAEAHLWLGVVLRRAGRNGEARKSLEKSLELNPARKWARQQLEKTPAK